MHGRGDVTARILVIEDNPTNLQLVMYLLQAFGHTVTGSKEGAEGIEMARRERPNLILLDIHMPKMDGYEVARRLRDDPDCCRIPIVAVTALAMVGDREKLLHSGFEGYISKPIDPATFPAQVHEFLGISPQSDPFPLETAAAATTEARPPSPRAQRAILLFVDNSPTNLQLARSILEPQGYEILSAPTVQRGLELAREKRPDMIVSDVHMPGESGYDFIDQVQADRELRRIPFVFLSSSAWTIRDHERARSHGAVKFLSRPIEAQQLAVELEACLQRQDAPPAASPGTRSHAPVSEQEVDAHGHNPGY